MAEIAESGGGQQHKGKKRIKKHSTTIDMTPMVDLMCLLITFFMLTSAFTKSKVMEIVFPEKQNEDEPQNAPQIDDSRAFHIILVDNDRVLWYEGLADPTKASLPTLNETDFSTEGIRRVLLRRNRPLFEEIYNLDQDVLEGTVDITVDSVATLKRQMKTDDEAGPIVLIKAYEGVRYKNMVDIIDEMAITEVARYSIVDINDVERVMVRRYFAAAGTAASSAN